MSDDALSTKAQTPFWAWAAVVATALSFPAAVLFGFLNYHSSKSASEFQEKYLDLQRSLTSFDAGASGADLVLTSNGDRFSTPDVVIVTPIFSSESGAPVSGVEVDLPIASGFVSPGEKRIVFNEIESRVCAYLENKKLCEQKSLSLDTLLVTFTVNGQKDTDPVSLGSS